MYFFTIAAKKNATSSHTKDQEVKLQKLEGEKSSLTEKIKLLEEKISKQDSAVSIFVISSRFPIIVIESPSWYF